MNLRFQPRANQIDILRPYMCRYHKRGVARHQIDKRFARADHAACRVNAQVHDHSVLRSPDFGPGKLIVDRPQTFAQLQDLAFSVAQTLGDFCSQNLQTISEVLI